MTTLKVDFKEPPKMAKEEMPINVELAHLEAMIKNFEAFDERAKYRNMRFFASKFSQYIPKPEPNAG